MPNNNQQSEDFNHLDDDHLDDDYLDVEENSFDSTSEENGEPEDKQSLWRKRFGSADQTVQKVFSRTSRNQPKKEASTLSKVLLGAFVVLLVVPFAILIIVESQRNNEDIPARTREQVMISRAPESMSSESSSDEESNENESGSESTGQENPSNDESADGQIAVQPTPAPDEPTQTQPQPQPQTPPEPAPAPEPAPVQSTTHTVSAGETWYAIARAYGVDVHTLMATNGASESTPIHPGDVVVIP